MIEDTEAFLDAQEIELKPTEEELKEEQLEEESLKVEFDKALNAQAEERAKTPFFAAAQTHAMIWQGFQQSVSELSSADLKRIIVYLAGYPFYIKEFDGNNPKAGAVAYRASKLVEAKSAMILCKAIEQEARVAQALDEQEALVQKLDPANFAEQIKESAEIVKENSTVLSLEKGE